MASSASSLHFLSLTPNSLPAPNSKTTAAASLSLFSASLKGPSRSSVSTSLSPFLLSPARPFKASPSLLVRNVALSSELDQEEDFLSDSEEQSFSPDLKLFVGNLPFNVDSANLAGLFERAGNVEMVEVIYDKMTGRSRGFGFVTMSSVEEVEAAAQQFNGYEIEGRPIRVNSGPPPRKEDSSFRGSRGDSSFRGSRGDSSFRGSRGESSFRGSRGESSFRESRGESSFRGSRGGSGTNFNDNNRVYVGNLSWGVDDLALETLFSEQGKVKEAKVVYDRDSGRSRGFGFVTYNSPTEVNNAIESLDGVDLNGRAIRVSMAEERPKRQF